MNRIFIPRWNEGKYIELSLGSIFAFNCSR